MEQNTTSGVQNAAIGQQKTIPGLVSVIVPVLNEALIINDLILHIRETAGKEPCEIIVADGGYGHSTLDAMEDGDVIKVMCPPGRGVQMNAGAEMASGEILLFLHADTRLPSGAISSIRLALGGRSVAGAFSLSIDSPKAALAVIAWFANLRSRMERIPYGDQAQFMTAELYRKLGGYADIPIMEDVELFRRIRELGLPIAVLHGKVVTSSRRWEKEGILRRTLTNWWLRIRYRFGATPESLNSHYRPHGGEADGV